MFEIFKTIPLEDNPNSQHINSQEKIIQTNKTTSDKKDAMPFDYKIEKLPSYSNVKDRGENQESELKLDIHFPDELISRLTSEESKNFILMGHLMPDQDCIGSIVATKELLEILGKNVQIVLEDGLSRGFKSVLNISHLIKQSVDEAKSAFKNNEKEPTVIVLDCATVSRAVHNINNSISLESLEKILIDHHITNSKLNNELSYIGKESSACEIVCGLAERLGIPLSSLSQNALCALHEGIMADTLGLRTDSTTSKTEELEKYLKELCGEDNLYEHGKNFKKNSIINKLDLLWKRNIKIINKFHFLVDDNEDKIAISYLTKDDIQNLNIVPADCAKVPARFASHPKAKNGIAVFILKKQDGFDITIKSNNRFSEKKCKISALTLVEKLAQKLSINNFGGHQDSAGLFIKKPPFPFYIKDIEKRLILAYKDAYKEYLKSKDR